MPAFAEHGTSIHCRASKVTSACPFVQSIDHARAERIGAHGVDAAALNDALARSAARARLAPGAPCRRRAAAAAAAGAARRPRTRSAPPPARLASDATDIVILGTGGSSLGGQTLAQLAGYAVEGVGALAQRPAPAFHGQSRSRHLRRAARAAAARDHALRRDLEVGRHRRDPDADHRRARRREGGRARGPHSRSVPRPHRAGQRRQAQRPARAAATHTRSRCSTTIPASADAFRC